MSCQSALALSKPLALYKSCIIIIILYCYGPGSVGGPMRGPWYLFHRLY
ncbi:unnamed protein product [Staurois parvus]|uniref:Uncharacterized protein n=1 Tax=Staurois parvus TaxID=386267 RepID=A0ABN9FT40_9NEOB|nr:unnamed protein product [Staurois parvus]